MELQELIGSGSCGAVYSAVSETTKEVCAVKIFSSMSINRKLLSLGLEGLQNMPEHPGLLRPLQFDFQKSPYFCAMPLVGDEAPDELGRNIWVTPTLEQCCGRIEPEESWQYLYEVCDSMAWLHKHNLIHCNLRPRNVLLDAGNGCVTKVTDPLQGVIQGIYHFETNDHYLHVPPEQVEFPDQLTVSGTKWDVYSFGVLAYRLLTGKYPRGGDVYLRELEKPQVAMGMTAIDGQAIMAAVKAQPKVVWPSEPADKWDARRREIIMGCLDLDPARRWADLREVMREFEKLEADYLIEDAREKIEIEKQRQERKVWTLRVAAGALGVAFVTATIYGTFRYFSTLKRAKVAESTILENAAKHLSDVTALKSTNEGLSQAKQAAEEAKRVADANLQISQEAVDHLLTQILELPTGLGLDADLTSKPIQDVLAFYEKERQLFSGNETLLQEQARNYFNSAQLLLRQQKRDEALEFFQKAREVLLRLLEKEPQHADLPRRMAMLGKTCRMLGVFHADDGRRAEALKMYRDAVKYLEPALKADETNRATREEAATAYYELGKRLRRDGAIDEAVQALGQVAVLLDKSKVPEDNLNQIEQFLVARARMEQALSLRDKGNVDDAVKHLFDAMEVMVKLVEQAAPNNKEQALALAEAYVEFGGMISGKLDSTDARDAQFQAQSILTELLRIHPNWAEAKLLQARSYGEMAGLERDFGNGSEALRKQTAAVEVLKELSSKNPNHPRFLTELTRQLGQHSQLLADFNKATESLKVATAAIEVMDNLLKQQENTLDELDQKTCKMQLAELYGIQSRAAELTRNKKLAKASTETALELWQALEAEYGKSDVIDQGVEWATGRLKSLK